MDFSAIKLVSPIPSHSCRIRPFSQDERKAQIDLAGQLKLLAGILTKAELGSQNKLLFVIIYKHKNQLRKQKTLQYAQRVVKMVNRLDSNAVKGCLNDLRMHISNTCRCIWDKASKLSCTDRKIELINRMVCKAQIIIETLRSCSSALMWVIIDLKSKTFLTFNIFLLSHFSRVRVLLLKIYEEFIKIFDLVTKLNLISKDVVDKLISAKHEFLFENETVIKDAANAAAMDDSNLNGPSSQIGFLDKWHIDSKDKVLFSGKKMTLSPMAEKQYVSEDEKYNNEGKTEPSVGICDDEMSKSDICDIGISIARKDTREFDVGKPMPVAKSHAFSSKNRKYHSNDSASQFMRKRKAKGRSIGAHCYCWKCQQIRNYFQFDGRRTKYFFKPISTKYCIIYKGINVKRKKKRTMMPPKNERKAATMSHEGDREQIRTHPPSTFRSFLEPRLPSANLDDIDLIFDVL